VRQKFWPLGTEASVLRWLDKFPLLPGGCGNGRFALKKINSRKTSDIEIVKKAQMRPLKFYFSNTVVFTVPLFNIQYFIQGKNLFDILDSSI
jgi:hypothetical protein